jgi:hypothetical protein
MPARGAARFRSTSTPSAFSGDTYSTRSRRSGGGSATAVGAAEASPSVITRARPVAGASGNISLSSAARNAASVLPEPVGANSSVERPVAMEAQPLVCAGVGAAKDPSNQRRTGS